MNVDSEDIPATVGLIIDSSGSMISKHAEVTKAALAFANASNPNDEVFIVNFNDEPYLDQDFTANVAKLREALDLVDSRGGTAVYDTVIAASLPQHRCSSHTLPSSNNSPSSQNFYVAFSDRFLPNSIASNLATCRQRPFGQVIQ